ncbi:MAG: hypothetical protein ACOC9W_02055, partial [Persicimonas sp.]
MPNPHLNNIRPTPSWLCWLAALACLAYVTMSSAPAQAHELPRERTLLVQVSQDSVEVMIVYLEPPGPTIDLLLRRYDLDGDGELVDAEAQLAGREWIRRAMYGLEFEVEGETPMAKPPEIKFRREQKGALSAAVYARWELPELRADQTRTVHVRLRGEASILSTEFNVRPGAGAQIAGVELPGRIDGLPRLPMLEAGEEATIRVRRSNSPSKRTAPPSPS